MGKWIMSILLKSKNHKYNNQKYDSHPILETILSNYKQYSRCQWIFLEL